jgi:phosphoglycolate phosphatase
MIKAAILDLDDTLCLTEEACFYMENEVLSELGRPPMSREIHQSTWGRPLFEVIKERSPGVDVEAFRGVYVPTIKRYTDTGKLDAVPEANLKALEELAKLGMALLILTSREHSEIEHILHPTHILARHIETFYYKDNMQYHKPDPRAFQHIEREHGWEPEECVYVGDSTSDAAAAKGAGLHFIASLESGLRTKADFNNYTVDAFIYKFPEVVDVVGKLTAKQ